MINLEEIKNASSCLENVIRKTPLIYSDIFSLECKNKVYIKPENLQKTGAFKIRGAYYKISKLNEDEKKRGLIAASAGNHAQGVAYAANKANVPAVIVMPKATPLIKVEATKKYGAEVVLYGECYDDAYNEAKRLEKENNYVFVHPFNDYDVIAGQGTIGIEILEELSDAEYILVPIGGGGLISGIAIAAKAINPNIKIIGVEPDGAKCMKTSVESCQIVDLKNVNTIAEGVAVRTPGDIPFSIVNEYVDGIVTVSDYEIMESFLLLLEKHKIVAENAGALSLAAIKKLNVYNKKVVCIVSGGNIDVVTISEMINRALVFRGRIFCFNVELKDTPGELVRIAQILADNNANVIKLEHNQFKTIDRFMHVQLEVTVETNSQEHIEQITNELDKGGYQIVKVY